MSQKFRVAVGSIMTECNHLGGQPTDQARFELYDYLHGEDALTIDHGAAGGMLKVLRDNDIELAPLLVATTCPGGPLTAECYTTLKTELLQNLRDALPVDGVLLSLHGSASADNAPDLEGDLLESVREIVGESTPVIASLDTHGHVTQRMIQNADALLGFAHYPHTDTFETGERAARLLLQTLRGEAKPAMAMAKVPVLVSGVNGSTEDGGPFAQVMNFAKAMEGKNGVLSTSVFLVHPYLDLPDMGGGGLVITNNDLGKAESLAREITSRYWEKRFELEPPTRTPQAAIAEGLKTPGGPILLVETADCSGGGAAGDSVCTLRALLDANLNALSLAPVVDPEAAAQCAQVGEGAIIEISIGHKLDPKWGEPLKVKGKVLRIGDGKFEYTGGIWEGLEGDMGTCAVLEIASGATGKIQVLITTNATYDWADEQFQAMQMNVRDAKFIVVKNPINYRVGYADVSKAAFILDTPGPTPATLRSANHQNVARPYFPLDEEIPNLQPQILKRDISIPTS
jgi:microcystin degradation protein MlrC